jgi:hypothetical protein
MIKFFRRIRQRLVSENKFSRYLLYAIGEIILVVIGILIALQINNWNENKTNKQTESVYLKEILQDFEINLKKSDFTTNDLVTTMQSLIGLLEQSALERPTISTDSINKVFSLISNMPTYISTDRVYNNLIGSGDFKLITNESIKNELANYNSAIDLLKLVQSTHEMELVQSFEPYIINYLDFQALKTNKVNDYKLPPPVEKDKILEVINGRKFRNIITLKLTILNELLEQNMNI